MNYKTSCDWWRHV